MSRGVERKLADCITCLEVEEKTSYRGVIAGRAARALGGIQELIQFSAYL